MEDPSSAVALAPTLRMRQARTAVVLLGLFFPTVFTWIYFVALADTSATAQRLAYIVGKGVQFGLPVLWVILTRKRVPRNDRRWGLGLAQGVGFGLLIGVAMWLAYRYVLLPTGFFDGPGEQVRGKVAGMGLDGPAQFAALGIFYSLGHSFLEEYYWRWFMFGELRQMTSRGPAIAISSLGFMAHHIVVLATFFGWDSLATWLFSFAVAIGGAIWAYLYERHGSLLGPWASHCLVDAAIFSIGFDLLRP